MITSQLTVRVENVSNYVQTKMNNNYEASGPSILVIKKKQKKLQ